MHQMRERVKRLRTLFEMSPSSTGFATTMALVRSTMVSKSMSALLPGHCRLASAQIQTKRFMGAPCAAAAMSSPH